jgi:hypothetical protein
VNNFTTNPMIDTYRWGRVTFQEAIELREADEAKAKAKAARTGNPVTLRTNVGMYEVFTTSGHYRIEKELDHDTEEETGWWVVYEVDGSWSTEMDLYFRTLREAKAHVAS